MTVERQEILDESQKSLFLDTPKFIDWFGSYYPEALEYEGEKYIIHKKPHKLFYPGIHLVEVVKLTSWLEYGDEKREYSSMIFDHGKIRPFTHWISINNRKEMNTKHPIVETQEHWYMKYDENLNCSKLEWLPEWYHPGRWNHDNWTVQLYTNEKEKSHSMIYGIDENYKLKPIEWVLEWMYISDIKDGIATLCYYEKKEGDDDYESYFYDNITKKVTPFTFKWFEDQSYKVEAIWTEWNVISIVNDQWKQIYFHFDGKAEVNDIITMDINAKISQLNKNSETAKLFSIEWDSHKEWFYHYKNGIIKPFEWLKWKEKIWYSKTYQFIDEKSLVKALVIISEDMRHCECRTFDENWVIKDFEWLKEWWKSWDRIRQSSNGDFFFLPIKIKWFGDETHSLLSKDSQKIIFYKDMLITWIKPKERKLTIVTHSWPDCDIQLDDNERNTLMKERDPNYTPDIPVDKSKELVENLQ